jgi:glutathione synthase/RimK-type ligase-like ATP-grasp enzyme
MIRFAWTSGVELECTECGERFDEEDLLTIDDPSNILTVKEKLAFVRAFKESE